jgi:hypothetical protein
MYDDAVDIEMQMRRASVASVARCAERRVIAKDELNRDRSMFMTEAVKGAKARK